MASLIDSISAYPVMIIRGTWGASALAASRKTTPLIPGIRWSLRMSPIFPICFKRAKPLSPEVAVRTPNDSL